MFFACVNSGKAHRLTWTDLLFKAVQVLEMWFFRKQLILAVFDFFVCDTIIQLTSHRLFVGFCSSAPGRTGRLSLNVYYIQIVCWVLQLRTWLDRWTLHQDSRHPTGRSRLQTRQSVQQQKPWSVRSGTKPASLCLWTRLQSARSSWPLRPYVSFSIDNLNQRSATCSSCAAPDLDHLNPFLLIIIFQKIII